VKRSVEPSLEMMLMIEEAKFTDMDLNLGCYRVLLLLVFE
jgi:hypothetical protein